MRNWLRFQFYPNEYNFTEFTFTGFNDSAYEVSLNLTNGGDFQGRWEDVDLFGITVQTSEGERYISDDYVFDWQHASQYGGTGAGEALFLLLDRGGRASA